MRVVGEVWGGQELHASTRYNTASPTREEADAADENRLNVEPLELCSVQLLERAGSARWNTQGAVIRSGGWAHVSPGEGSRRDRRAADYGEQGSWGCAATVPCGSSGAHPVISAGSGRRMPSGKQPVGCVGAAPLCRGGCQDFQPVRPIVECTLVA